jgi:hypothetical protein
MGGGDAAERVERDDERDDDERGGGTDTVSKARDDTSNASDEYGSAE